MNLHERERVYDFRGSVDSTIASAIYLRRTMQYLSLITSVLLAIVQGQNTTGNDSFWEDASPHRQSPLFEESNQNHTCAMKTPFLTCSEAANISNVDTCCTEKNGGLFLQTYYWMTHTGREEVGQLLPRNRWTIHGLWIDYVGFRAMRL